jgi:hypothetical protein
VALRTAESVASTQLIPTALKIDSSIEDSPGW